MNVLYCLTLITLAITRLDFMLVRFVINQRHQQIQQNRELIRYILMEKKTVGKTARRSCWVKKGRTSVWWDKFLTNEVPESESRDNFCMSKRRFYELCDMLRCPCHIETSQLICPANQLTGFYVRGTSLVTQKNCICFWSFRCINFIYN